MATNSFLPNDTFLTVVAATPLVAVDLVVLRGSCEILLGLRNNRPAQGFWFVPGGRILKNETIQATLTRIAATEMGFPLGNLPNKPTLMGAYEHFYADCFAESDEAQGVSTHYVVLSHLLQVPTNFAIPSFDTQHAEMRWWPLTKARSSSAVHQFTKDYLNSSFLPNGAGG
jgi:colanic acid biosynthesis protein WcaH